MFWLLLLGIFGVFTYYIVQRSVVGITRTPVWMLWVVMMIPAFIMTGWILLNGEAPIPSALLFGPFLVCPLLYWMLIQWGRRTNVVTSDATETAAELTQAPPTTTKPPLRPIDRQEEAALHTCFPWSIFYLQNVEYRPQALICRGQLRSSPEVAYRTIRENVEAQFGDRFLIVFQEGLNGKPFFALVPNPQARNPNSSEQQTAAQSANRPLVAIGLLVATLFTTTLAGAIMTAPAGQMPMVNLGLLQAGLPYGVALMSILGVHELAHYITARRYHMRVTYPYFIPVPPADFFPIGTFGAFISLRSPMPNRRALFDVGIAGPLAGFVMTLPFLFWGLAHSESTPLTEASGLLNFSSFNPHASLFLVLCSKIAMGSRLTATSAIDLHPVAVAGCVGVIVTALNLMPVGQLDGGHIVHAMFGQRVGAFIGQIARFLALALSFVQQEFLLWAILLFLIPAVDEPALNDVSELNNWRDGLGLLALTLLVAIILPIPPVLARFLF